MNSNMRRVIPQLDIEEGKEEMMRQLNADELVSNFWYFDIEEGRENNIPMNKEKCHDDVNRPLDIEEGHGNNKPVDIEEGIALDINSWLITEMMLNAFKC